MRRPRGPQFLVLLLALIMPASRSAHAEPAAPAGSIRVEQLITRGAAAEAAGDSLSAIAFYREAVSAGPRDPRGYEALGKAYLAYHETSRAIEAFEAGVEVTGGSDGLWRGLLAAHRENGDAERELLTIRKLREVSPEQDEPLELLLEATLARGLWTEALNATRALLERAQQRAPAKVAELQVRERALEKLLGKAERVRGFCDADPLRRALARCP